MILRDSKLLFIIGLLFVVYNTTQAQKTLIRETNNTHSIDKSWKVEWGILAGVGISNVLKPNENPTLSMSEGVSTYRVMYAPRPEAEVGIFGEIGKTKSFFSIQAHFTYTMRAVPQPVFYALNQDIKEVYKSTYLNGLTGGLLFFFKPVDKFKIGVGFDATNFLITQDISDSNIGEYTELYSTAVGLKAVFSYQVSPRVDINVYGRLGKINVGDDFFKEMAPNDISAGMAIGYRLCGKEIHYKSKTDEEKKVYRLDYTK